MRILLLFLASFSCLVFPLEYIEPGVWRHGNGETILFVEGVQCERVDLNVG